ncbi:MAG: GIY-YIG nuclease family protein, partial [Oceanicoccus sp.]|uniref:GIY-YIG nuclease family protein n=1 Tax=Oceanicoccus sp. TaxID=2691044 RepID=UPI00261D6583
DVDGIFRAGEWLAWLDCRKAPVEPARKSTAVYFVADGKDFLKIGMSDSTPNRLAQMQTGNPRELKIVYEMAFATKRIALNVEQLMHYELSEYRERGEWFRWEFDAVETLYKIVETYAPARVLFARILQEYCKSSKTNLRKVG